MQTILFIGRTGVGKSSLINAILRTQRAWTDPFEPCTESVNRYRGRIGRDEMRREVELVDLPGLEEGDAKRDARHLEMLRGAMREESVSLLVYAARLTETRLRPEERRAIASVAAQAPATLPIQPIFTHADQLDYHDRQRAFEVQRGWITGEFAAHRRGVRPALYAGLGLWSWTHLLASRQVGLRSRFSKTTSKNLMPMLPK